MSEIESNPIHLSQAKILCVRVDRIGDLVLTLPADQAFLAGQTVWLIQSGLEFLCESAVPRREFHKIRREFSLRQFLDLVRWLKSQNFTDCVIFHAPWWVSLAVWLARIPHRSGRLSQWHSFVFLNEGIRQSRVHASASEFDFNCELTKSHRLAKPVKFQPLTLAASNILLNEKSQLLSDLGLVSNKYVVVHAGMSGSARNWSVEAFASLVFRAAQRHMVVLTGTESDRIWLDPLRANLAKRGDGAQIMWLDGRLNVQQLLEVLSHAFWVVAPSTGVVHLAASLGTPTVGLYSPVRSQHPDRWGPRGERVKVIMPDVDCPAIKQCLGKECRQYDCMERITVEAVLDATKKLSENQGV